MDDQRKGKLDEFISFAVYSSALKFKVKSNFLLENPESWIHVDTNTLADSRIMQENKITRNSLRKVTENLKHSPVPDPNLIELQGTILLS